MELTQQPCPHCSCPLVISWDMWGPFYVCPECGFSAEDEDELSQRNQKGRWHRGLTLPPPDQREFERYHRTLKEQVKLVVHLQGWAAPNLRELG